MPKIDLRKELKALFQPSAKEVTAIKVPAFTFLMIDGKGDPNTSDAYREAIEALYAASYGIKFAVKKATATDYAVMPLEGLWWAKDMASFTSGNRDAWQWTMMIQQPKFATKAIIKQALVDVAKKKDLPALAKLRVESFTEGPAAQIMHIGPYSAEGPTIAKVHAFIAAQGKQLSGKHHEIYLGDPRKGDPAKLKTVIRQPMT